jgi:hypothetical protein
LRIALFKIPESRLSASNSAVLASESFLVPMTLMTESRSSAAAFESLRRAYDEISGFIPALASTVPNVSLVAFEASVSPRMSRVDVNSLPKKDAAQKVAAALREQADVVITPIDDKKASVTKVEK